MTPAQIAKIMALVDALSLASYHTGTLVGVGNRPDKVEAALKSSAETRAAVEAALRDAPQAEGWVMVPKTFLSGFHTLAHNWSLEAIPPDYLWGTEKDVFKSTYRRCGHDLAKLKDLLAATPSAPTAKQGLKPCRHGHIHCLACMNNRAPTAVEPVVKDSLTTAAGVEPRDEREANLCKARDQATSLLRYHGRHPEIADKVRVLIATFDKEIDAARASKGTP